MGTLKDVLVKQTIFTVIDDALTMKQYITDCVNEGSGAPLYKNPFIQTAFYTLGTGAAKNIQTALDDYKANKNTTNESAIKDAVAAGKVWLKAYTVQVEPIANADINRNTREEAATNIEASNLTAQKLASSPTGDPEVPVLTGKSIGGKNMEILIVNGVTYTPRRTMFIAVQMPDVTSAETPDPLVTLTNGQISVVSVGTCETLTLTATGKGRKVTLATSTIGKRYGIWSYSQNSKKQVSKLSLLIIVQM